MLKAYKLSEIERMEGVIYQEGLHTHRDRELTSTQPPSPPSDGLGVRALAEPCLLLLSHLISPTAETGSILSGPVQADPPSVHLTTPLLSQHFRAGEHWVLSTSPPCIHVQREGTSTSQRQKHYRKQVGQHHAHEILPPELRPPFMWPQDYTIGPERSAVPA